MEILKNYLTQKSTWLGIVKIGIALGLFTLTPEIQNQIVDFGVGAAELVIAGIGIFFVVKNENK